MSGWRAVQASSLLAFAAGAAPLCLAQEPPTVPRVERPVFFVHGVDGPNGPALREELRPDHFAYVEAHYERYAIAGPLRVGPDETVSESLFLIFADDLADARAFAEGDPFAQGGVYETLRVERFTPAVGAWIGGKIWE